MQRAGRRSTERQGARVPDSSRPRVKDKPSCPPRSWSGSPGPSHHPPRRTHTHAHNTRADPTRVGPRAPSAPGGGGLCGRPSGPASWRRKGVRRVFSAPRVPRACEPGRGPPADVHVCSARSLAAEERLLRSVPRLRDAFPPGAERRPAARPCPQPAWRSWFCRSRHPDPPHPPHADRVTTGGAPRRPRSAPERLALRGSRGALRGAGRTGAEVPFFCSGSFRIKGRQLGL